MLTCMFLGLVATSTLQFEDISSTRNGNPIDGEYRLQWDDAIDGQIDSVDKVCLVRIQVRGQRVTGEFIGPVAGENRKAKIEGRVEGSRGTSLFTFRQVERGYTCGYQMTLGTGSFLGVWHDTKGRSGDFILLKYQPRIIKALSSPRTETRG